MALPPGVLGAATTHMSAPGSSSSPATPTRRGTELALLGFGLGLVVLAFVLISENQSQTLKPEILLYIAGYAVLFGVAHLAVRKFAPYADPLILPCAALLNGLSIAMLYRLDPALAQLALESGHGYSNAAPKQLLWTALSLVAMVVGAVGREGPPDAVPLRLHLRPGRPGAAGAARRAAVQHLLRRRRQAVDHHRPGVDPARRVRQGADHPVRGRVPGGQAGPVHHRRPQGPRPGAAPPA